MESPLTHSPRHDRTTTAILDAAAHVLAVDGTGASMTDVANAAGVGRATLYPYFETRESLLEALAVDAVADVGARLADAGLDGVTVELAIERIARAVIAVGERYSVIVREEIETLRDNEEVERLLGAPIRAVFARGVETGVIRSDVPAEILLELFGGLLTSTIKLVGQRRVGRAEAAAALTRLLSPAAPR